MQGERAVPGYRILCVDDEVGILKALQRLFMEEDWEVLTAETAEEALDVIAETDVDLVLSDFRLPGMDGVELLKRVKVRHPDSMRIVLSGYADLGTIVAALNEGEVYRFLVKPWNDDELIDNLRKALRHYQLARENRRLTEEVITLNMELEAQVQARTKQLARRSRSLVFAWRMLELIPMPVVGIGPDLRIRFANIHARAIFGSPERLLVDVPLSETADPDVCEAVQAVIQDGRGPRTVRSGALFHVRPMVVHGHVIGALLITHGRGSPVLNCDPTP